MSASEWSEYSKKRMRHPRNPELVTGRVNIVNNRNVIRVSIGKTICELLDFTRNDRVCISVHKQDKKFILLTKSNDPQSYKLISTEVNRKSNFLAVTFRYDFHEAFKLSQTVVLDYEIGNEGLLLVSIEKLKWRE